MAKNHVNNFRGEYFFTPNDKIYVKEEPKTPIEEDFGDHNVLESSFDDCGMMKKSLSMSDLTALRKDLLNLDLNDKNEVYDRYRKPFDAPQELSKTKFVSMAEAIYHYQVDTPGRYHSSKPQFFKSQNRSSRPVLTVPQSPMLRSKARARPVHIMSQQEKEEIELEELKKKKIKARPIPKSVIEGPINLPDVQKKPRTIPEPFNLTELQKKPLDLPDYTFKFKARPAPKHILEKPQIPSKPLVQVTKPTSPKFHYKRGKSADQLKSHNEQNLLTKQKSTQKQRHGPLQPEPFSFAKRDEEIKRRKEQWIKQQIEEERKQAALFKAQPLPDAVKKQMCRITSKASSSSNSSENKENYVKFEARPATVLFKEPFKPVLQPFQVVKTVPFALSSEKRAANREKFDQLLKEKEEEQERLRLQSEREQQEMQERINKELRAKLVHHAKPAPIPIPFVPEKSSADLTVPETPKFVRKLKQNKFES